MSISFKEVMSIFREFWPLALSVTAGIGIILAIVTIVMPKTFDAWERLQDLKQKKDQLSLLKSKEEFLQKIDQAKLVQSLTRLEMALPSQKNVFLIFDTVYGLSGEFQTEIPDMQLNPGLLNLDNVDLEQMSFPFSASIPSDRIIPLVKTIYSVYPFFTINAIKMNSLASGQTTVDLDLTTYSQALPKKLGDTQTPLTSLTPKEEELDAAVAKWKSYPPAALLNIEATAGAKRQTPFGL